MATYAIGDIQGCFTAFSRLLQEIRFNPEVDTLWCTGDLVNRGPGSLDVLRFFKSLGERHQIVLGNHDLHLLAVACGKRKYHAGDTFNDILTSPDKQELLDWLRARPLLVHDEELNFVMTHAGIAPFWDIAKAKQLAHEVESMLRGDYYADLFAHMYGSLPDRWEDDLTGYDRSRCIVNHFTRMRYCYADGRLELSYKGPIAEKPEDLIPWFEMPNRPCRDLNLIFGHWASLGGVTGQPHLFALDTGCVWGGALTAMRLEDCERFQVDGS